MIERMREKSQKIACCTVDKTDTYKRAHLKNKKLLDDAYISSVAV